MQRSTDPTRPVTMTFPMTLISKIDELAGRDKRSSFVVDALRTYLASQEPQADMNDVKHKFDTLKQQTS